MNFLLLPLMAWLGWFFSSRTSESTRRTARGLSLVATAIFLVAIVSGLLESRPASWNIHKWSGHALTIVVWLCIPFAAGVGLQRNLRRPGFALVQFAALLCLFGAALLASFTGYLHPSDTDNLAAEEARMRFTVLHLFALPSLTAALLAVWFWSFRADVTIAAEPAAKPHDMP